MEVTQWGPGTQPWQGSGAEAFCTFAHILKNGYRKCVFRYIDIVRKL